MRSHCVQQDTLSGLHFQVDSQAQCTNSTNGTSVEIDGVVTQGVDLQWATLFPNFNNLGEGRGCMGRRGSSTHVITLPRHCPYVQAALSSF